MSTSFSFVVSFVCLSLLSVRAVRKREKGRDMEMSGRSQVREQQQEESIWAMAERAADDLYEIRDTYFPPNPLDKISKLQSQSDLSLRILDTIPSEHRQSKVQRAMYEYLKGKILDVVPEYRKEAEDHLSKALKLNPLIADAWLCLGNCIWKKGDLPSARNTILRSLSKGPNKRILCLLSMLERRMAQGAENQEEIVAESIQHAKDAIVLDIKDGNSWYNLGNALLTSFFVTGAWDHSKLHQSLKAYQHAEKDERMKFNPDLYFNCATVNKYLENYERALSGFEAAAIKDPSLNATEEVQKIVNLLNKLDNIMQRHARSKRFATLASSLAAVNLNASYKRASIDHLSEGLNKAVAIVGKVLFLVEHENVIPLYYLVCDSNQICFVLSVYGMRNDVIKEDDQITLLQPCYHYIDFSWKEKLYHFKSVRVDFIEQVLLNGKALVPNCMIRSSIYAQHKP